MCSKFCLIGNMYHPIAKYLNWMFLLEVPNVSYWFFGQQLYQKASEFSRTLSFTTFQQEPLNCLLHLSLGDDVILATKKKLWKLTRVPMSLGDRMHKFSTHEVIMDNVFHAWVIKPIKSNLQLHMYNKVN